MAFTGLVTKVGVMNKTATITVPRYVIHKRTGKRIERSTKILTHDEHNGMSLSFLFGKPWQLQLDDTVFIRHTAPISARKRFTLERIIKSPLSDAVSTKAAMVAAAAKTQQRLDRAAARDQAAQKA
ncbi:hypothetical protein FIBSPDRAFT_758178 [Athelia psychrophila]|uniref:Nucleic acid-binding protein n=1 Tax=Athelia psychrophila TaxID=1759441 RepID=A0A165ZEU7_9AGAM|nr:hypothetical protein FIBSPDRAFT_758178 [Fibularhizoctonia sp. CBS 109695]